MDEPQQRRSDAIRPVPTVSRPCAPREAGKILAVGHGHQQHALAFRNEGELLSRLPLPGRPQRLGMEIWNLLESFAVAFLRMTFLVSIDLRRHYTDSGPRRSFHR
jgi:hypothetical protein